MSVVAAACTPAEPPPPNLSGGAIALAGGATATNTTSIQLDVTAPSAAIDMQVASGVDPAAGPWIPVAATTNVTIPGGDGEKVISARFRAGSTVSTVVSTTVLLDTVAPTVSVTSHQNGDVIDASQGALNAIDGDAQDVGSGVARVLLTAAGHSSDAELGVDGVWAHAVDSYEDRSLAFVVEATDAAGNVGSTTLNVSILGLAASDEPVVRPTTLQVDPAMLVSVSDDQVVLSGDQRALLADRTVVTSGRVAGVAPDGLIRKVIVVSFDSGSGTTAVDTEDAELLDAFARFSIDSPEPQPQPDAGRAAGALLDNSACDEELAKYDVAVRSPWLFDTAAPEFDFATDGYVGLFADAAIEVDIGWWDVDVKGGISAGVLLCANTSVTVTAEVKAAFPISSLQAIFDSFSAAACFPVGGVPLCLDASPELRVSTKGQGTFDFSGFFGFRVGVSKGDYSGKDKHTTTVLKDLNLDQAEVGLSVSLGMPYFSVGVKVGGKSSPVGATFFSAQIGPIVEFTGAGGRLCLKASAEGKFELQLDLKIVTFKLKLGSVTIAEQEFACQTWSGPPPTTSTTTTSTSTTSTSTTSTSTTSTTTTSTTIPQNVRPITFRIDDNFWFPGTPQSVKDEMVAFKPFDIWTDGNDLQNFSDSTRIASGTTDGNGVALIPDDIAGPVLVHIWKDCVYNFASAETLAGDNSNQIVEPSLVQLCF